MGRESKQRGGMCVLIADSVCCTAETNTALQNNYILGQFFKKWCIYKHCPDVLLTRHSSPGGFLKTEEEEEPLHV